jgi:hypothetical protein
MDVPMEMKLARTTIINGSTQPVRILGGYPGKYHHFHRLHPGKDYALEYILNDHCEFAFKVDDTSLQVNPEDGAGHLFKISCLGSYCEEITIYGTLDGQGIEFAMSKKREESQVSSSPDNY